MTTTFLLNTSLTGAGATGNDLLAGTAVANAGPGGKVWCSATTATTGDEASGYIDATFTLFGRESGATVVPSDSNFVYGDGALSKHGVVIFYGQVRPGEPLALNITSTADTSPEVFSVMVKTE